MAVAGFAAPGFEGVAEAFARNFDERGEVGAAFAAERDGELVVDLWAGSADLAAGRPWQRDTLALVFSGTKGFVALCLLALVDRGKLALDDPVCAHWPEFAAAGKERITVGELASHRARLPAVRTPVVGDAALDDARLAALLAAQAPEGDPRVACVYHALTYGWLCGELVRRVSGCSVGRFFAKEIAEPMGLDLWIGLPDQHEPRVATLTYGCGWVDSPLLDETALAADELFAATWTNPPLFPRDRIPWNSRAYRAAEIPGANAIGSARAIAQLYGCLARGGERGSLRLLSPDAIALGRAEQSRFEDPFTGEPMAYGVGFQLQTDCAAFGPPPDAFGHSGAGGSVHGCWPAERVGFSYVMNELRAYPDGDLRAQSLLTALHDAVRTAR